MSFQLIKFRKIFVFISGLLIGFLISSQLRSFRLHNKCLISDKDEIESQYIHSLKLIDHLKNVNGEKLFIGIMTAQKYSYSRVHNIYKTWAYKKNNVAFFSSSLTRYESYLPLIALPSVDDSYPPQKKSFLMFKFINDHLLDYYDWFVRADDDVYINIDRLNNFLSRLDSNKPYFIGQTGLGNKQEFGHLNLESNENFCMGGPGIIMSHATLKLMAPNIQYCLKHLYSTHEDVEIGRCVRKFVNISCTWSYEMQSVFYHNFTGHVVWSTNLKKLLRKAITLHPIRSQQIMYKIHDYFLKKQQQKLRLEINKIHREITKTKRILGDSLNIEFNLNLNPLIYGDPKFLDNPLELVSSHNVCESRNDIIAWDYLNRYYFSGESINPKKRIDGQMKSMLDDNLIDILHYINKDSRSRGRIIDFKNLYYGYFRVDPTRGAQFIFDLLVIYRRYKTRQMSLQVHKHAYAIKSFSIPLIREVKTFTTGQVVNIIVPLSGRIKAFLRFISDFISLYSQDPNVKLLFVLFPDHLTVNNEYTKTRNYIRKLMNSGLPVEFVELAGRFSRGAGLQRGASLFHEKDLLFFVDIDMFINGKVIERVRLNTILGLQVYYPIVFSQYSSLFFRNGKSQSKDINESNGYWRQFGFGIVSLYKSDLQSAGGMNVNIQGWGKEDVDLFDKFIKTNRTIFRAPDPDLIHIYHEIKCDPSLYSSQYEMCLGTKLSSLGSLQQMSEYIYSNNLL